MSPGAAKACEEGDSGTRGWAFHVSSLGTGSRACEEDVVLTVAPGNDTEANSRTPTHTSSHYRAGGNVEVLAAVCVCD